MASMLDNAFIWMILNIVFLSCYHMSQDVLGDYLISWTPKHIAALWATQIPLCYIITISYYFISYFGNTGRTFGNSHYKSIVVNQDFILNEHTRMFNPSMRQSLLRSLGQFIASLFFYTPNFIAFADPLGRSFSDYISGTMTITQSEFYTLFTNKISLEFQLQIDIDQLDQAKIQSEVPLKIAA